MDAELPEEKRLLGVLNFVLESRKLKCCIIVIRVYSNIIDIDDEETEEKEYFNTLKTKFFTVITDYDFKKQFPDSKTDL